MVFQGQSDQQRHAGLGRRPIVVGQRPTTNLLNRAEFGCSEENESCSGGYPELIYSVMHVLVCTHGWRLVTGITGVGRRPTPEPPAGARMIGAWRKFILVN